MPEVTEASGRVPTADQIRAYLLANGWEMGDSGSAAYLMVTKGYRVRMLHEPTEHDLFQAVFDIALAENRHPADVRESILGKDASPAVNEGLPAIPQRPRLFRLERTIDHSGVSGPGHVADGVVWADGTVSMRWLGKHASTVSWDGIEHADAIHGHGGDTRFVFDDTLPGTAEPFNGLPAMLRTRRESLGLSQRGAAEKIGISFSTVSRIEAGQQPELAPLIKVLDWLGMRIGWVAKETCDA